MCNRRHDSLFSRTVHFVGVKGIQTVSISPFRGVRSPRALAGPKLYPKVSRAISLSESSPAPQLI